MIERDHNPPLSYGSFVMIWLGLIILTGLTITATAMNLGNFSLVAAVLIASAKASLVVFIFMNLKDEPLIFRLMLGVALVTLASIMVLTFFDTSYR